MFIKAKLPENEGARLEELRYYDILDTLPEPAFDDLTRIAAHVCGTPVSLISFVDADRQWFKAKIGIQISQTSRDVAFCAHAILQSNVFVVPNALEDKRFAEHPLVTSEPHIRSYAGAPLVSPSGQALGTLCVIDHVPRKFTPAQLEVLQLLARQVVAQLQLRRVQAELQRNYNLLGTVVEGTTDAIYVKDQRGRYVMINSAGAQFLGRSVEQVIGKDDSELFSPETAHAIMEGDQQIMASGKTLTSEDIRTAAGTTRTNLSTKGPLRDAKGNVVGLIGISRDISERKVTEESLRLSEARFRGLFEHVLDGVYQSTPEGHLLTANPALVRMLGFDSEEELLSADIRNLYINPQERRKWTKKLEEEGVLHNAELVLRRTDGRELVVLENARAVRAANGKVLYYEGTLTDITERKKIERSKDELISVVAHELRTPLTSIQGSLVYMLERMSQDLPPQAQKMVEMASRGTHRLVRLINDLLDIDKIESGDMVFDLKAVDLIPLLEQTVEATQSYAKQFEVRCVLEQSLPGVRVYADADRLIQVVTNLISNAVKFSPKAGIARLSVSQPGKWVRVSVADLGPGIPEEFQPRIFQKFAQSQSADARQKGGSGLGLYISKAIIEALGGRIGFHTSVDAGTTFYFELPASNPT